MMNLENKFNLPEAYVDDYTAFQMPNEGRCLVFGDVHVPFHNVRGLSAMIEYALMCGITSILINGDFFDHFSLSSFDKDPDHVYTYPQGVS